MWIGYKDAASMTANTMYLQVNNFKGNKATFASNSGSYKYGLNCVHQGATLMWFGGSQDKPGAAGSGTNPVLLGIPLNTPAAAVAPTKSYIWEPTTSNPAFTVDQITNIG